MPNIQRCDCCGEFGEIEEVTIVIKKHGKCDINAVFGNKTRDLPKPSMIGGTQVGTGSTSPFSERQEEIVRELQATIPTK